MIEWSKDIEFKGFDPYDLKPVVSLVDVEGGFASIRIEYSTHGEYESSDGLIYGSNAEYFDEICVGVVTGKPLNPFISEDFTVINTEEE